MQLDARDEAATAALLTEHRCDVLMNATDPRFVMPLFTAALHGGANYMDMAMSLSDPDRPSAYRRTGVKLGDEQFALADEWEQAGKLALVGMGVEPGLSDVFARYAADELFGEIDELGVRDGANLAVAGYDFAPDLLHLDDDRGMPQPAGHLGEGAAAGSPPRRSASRRSSRSRPGSARSSASTWSTRKCC